MIVTHKNKRNGSCKILERERQYWSLHLERPAEKIPEDVDLWKIVKK
jgi:hypothetical protein